MSGEPSGRADDPGHGTGRQPPFQVSYVTGDVTADGGTIVLRVETERNGPVQLSLPTVDLQQLVTLLLILSGKAALRGKFAATSETFWTKPVPLHGVSVGVDDDRAILTLEVGASILSFSLSAGCLSEIGRTALVLTAPSPSH